MSYYGQIGRQPFRPGQWSRYQGHSHKTYVQNNFYGSVFGGYGMNSGYGCGWNNNCCGGNNKLMNWMLGLGMGTSLLGGILGFFGVGRGDGGGGKTNKDDNAGNTDTKTNTNTRTKTNSGDDDDNKVDKNNDNSETRTKNEYKYTVDAKKTPDKEKTHTFNVRYDKASDKCDNPWNITAWMYTDENGNKIPNSEIKALRDAIFGKNVGLKVGNIELPDSITVNGKKYKYNPKAELPPLGDRGGPETEFYSVTTKTTESGKWVPYLNGHVVPGYEQGVESKEKAIEIATEKGEALKKEHEKATADNK